MRLKLVFILFSFCFFFLFSLTTPSLAITDWNTYRVSSNNSVPLYSQLVSNNSGYGIVWTDNRISNPDIYFAPVNILVNKFIRIGSEVQITNNTVSDETPALVWNGRDYGLFWSQGRSNIYFARFNEYGKKIVQDISLGVKSKGYAIHVSAVWNGDEYGVVWWDVRDAPSCNPSGTRGRAFFTRVNNSGQMLGEEIPVSDAFSNPWQDYKPLIVWNGEKYAIFWNDSREEGECRSGNMDIYMATITKDGRKILGDIKLQKSSPISHLYDVIWDGTDYALTYNVGTSYLAKMDTSGNTLISDIIINSNGFSGSPKISWKDNNYYVSWFDNRNRTEIEPNINDIYYTMFDNSGDRILPDTIITSQKDSSYDNTQIAFLDGNLGVTWLDSSDGNPQVYFASNLANYPKLSKPQKPLKPIITRPTKPPKPTIFKPIFPTIPGRFK